MMLVLVAACTVFAETEVETFESWVEKEDAVAGRSLQGKTYPKKDCDWKCKKYCKYKKHYDGGYCVDEKKTINCVPKNGRDGKCVYDKNKNKKLCCSGEVKIKCLAHRHGLRRLLGKRRRRKGGKGRKRGKKGKKGCKYFKKYGQCSPCEYYTGRKECKCTGGHA